MEMFIELGSFSSLSPTAYYLYGMVMTMMSAWLALNLERPKKQD